ncbi:chitinase 10, partial [Biomphalaria glabrata]
AAFIRSQGLAGVALWSLEHDDFSNLCQNGTWPLLRTLARELPVNRLECVGH